MTSNLPPGVSASDIPGNRPEDILWDECWDAVTTALQPFGIDPDWLADSRVGQTSMDALVTAFVQTILDAREHEMDDPWTIR